VGGSGSGTPNTLASSRIGNGSGSPNVLAPAQLPGTIAPGSPSSLAPNRIGSQPATTVQTFTYDGAGRLTSEAGDGFSAISWTYDDAGNRTSQSSAGQTTTYQYDDDNRLLSTTTGSNVTTFSYDPNGSLLERSGTGETLLYGWDTAGRLTSITRNGSTQASFAYDGDGNRRSKTSNGQTTTYVNDARGLAQVLQAIGPSSTVTYVGNAQYDSSKPTETEKWGYTLSDAQNAKLLVDNAGNLAHRWEWEPFGRARADTGNTAAAFSFSGEQRDDETGLINLRARYYDPGIGRFLSRDSIPGVMTLPQSWNRFSYVENDPINATDPSGHKKSTKIKYPMGMDPDDDSHQRKKARACKNPGQYTGSCKGGPPNAAYNADGEAQHEAKKAGQAFAAGNLATGMAHLQASMHFASTAGTAAAHTAAAQASASLWAAYQAIHGAWSADRNGDGDFMLSMKQLAGDDDQADPEEVNSWYYWDVPSGVPWGELHTRVQFMWGVRVGYGEETAMALWTYLVGTNNPWDWKKDFPEDSPERQPAADVGNFMYGATAAAAGWQTLGEVRRGAGAAQWLDNQRRSPPKPSSGTPWDLNPLSCYGDRCRDQRYVVNGWFWYQSHVAGKEFMPSSLPGQLTPIMH
jgi:RHS repeat-associated protein